MKLERGLAAAGIAWLLASGTAAADSRLDGITILTIENDRDAYKALTGNHHTGPEKRYLVSFVSARGTYAALLGSGPTERDCIAWGTGTPATAGTVSFGLPDTPAKLESGTPKLCNPFSLNVKDAATVAVDVVRGDPGARTYLGDWKVVVRVPLIALDWTMPAFLRHTVAEVPLGPMPLVEAAVADRGRMRLSELTFRPHYFMSEFYRQFEVRFRDVPGDRDRPANLGGKVTPREMTEWPWDVLYAVHQKQTYQQAVTGAAFREAVDARYGEPSFEDGRLVWAYDLEGNKLSRDDAAPTNCLATMDRWLRDPAVSSESSDYGMWGCALLVVMSSPGKIVSEYRIEAVAGYAMAMNHFFRRLVEVEERKKVIERLLNARPRF